MGDQQVLQLHAQTFDLLASFAAYHMLPTVGTMVLCSADGCEQAVPPSAVALCPRCLCTLHCKADDVHCMYHKPQCKS